MRCESLDDLRFMELFELALHTPADGRRRRLIEACEGDEQLAEEVVARAERHDEMGEFLLHAPIVALAAEIRFAPGETVADRFHVIREVGEGGMGIVYEVFDRKVGAAAGTVVGGSVGAVGGPVGIAIGSLVGSQATKIFDTVKGILGDDVFPAQTVDQMIISADQKLTDSRESLTFKGHGGKYLVQCEWHMI